MYPFKSGAKLFTSCVITAHALSTAICSSPLQGWLSDALHGAIVASPALLTAPIVGSLFHRLIIFSINQSRALSLSLALSLSPSLLDLVLTAQAGPSD